MKKRLQALVVLLFLVFPFGATAFGYSHIVAFGDSLTDGGFWGVPATDDKVWVEYMADSMGATLDNRAIGGARTTSQPIDLDQQVMAYLSGVKPVWDGSGISIIPAVDPTAALNDPETLFSIWIGGNDSTYHVFEGGHTAQDAVNSMMQSMGLLYAFGARNFLVPNVPDVGNTLMMGGNPYLTDFCIDFNIALEIALSSFEAQQGVNLYKADVFGIFDGILQEGDQDKINELFWIDGFHPSSTGHQLIAESAYAAVEPVPEPATFMLLGLGLVGLAGYRRKVALR